MTVETTGWSASWRMAAPSWLPNKEQVNRSRLRIDARKWVLARMNAKKYGERSLTELSGADGGAIRIERTFSSLKELEPDELAMLETILRHRAGTGDE